MMADRTHTQSSTNRFAVSFAVQLFALLAGGEDARLALPAIDPKTGMTGGLLFALWLVLTNLVNSALNVLFICTAAGLQSGLDFGLFIGVWLIGYLVLIPVIGLLAKRLKMPEVKPWGRLDWNGKPMYASQ